MELDEPTITFKPALDKRPHIPEPPPVRVVAVEDVRLNSQAGIETQLDSFYVGLLRFEREGASIGDVIYKAENVKLRFAVLEPPLLREDFRPLTIAIPSLATLEAILVEREIEFLWQRGLMPGHDSLLIQDPAGNWIAIEEWRAVG